jgi:hypothetical protein
VFLPDLPKPAYRNLLETLEQEFTYTFGGATIVRGLDGSYLSRAGLSVRDRINLIFTDAPFSLQDNLDLVATYADSLRDAAYSALEEEAILVAVVQVYHSESTQLRLRLITD